MCSIKRRLEIMDLIELNREKDEELTLLKIK